MRTKPLAVWNTPEQMLAQLKSAGVKDAEIEATGLGKLFAEKAKGSRPEPGARGPEAEATGASRVLAETPEYKRAEDAAVKAFKRDLDDNESLYFEMDYDGDGNSIPVPDDAKPSLYRSNAFSILPATAAAVEAGARSLGFDLFLGGSVASASRYGTIEIGGQKKKVRVADHERQSGLHDGADFNIAPGSMTPFDFFGALLSAQQSGDRTDRTRRR